jgi:hypothetical protein
VKVKGLGYQADVNTKGCKKGHYIVHLSCRVLPRNFYIMIELLQGDYDCTHCVPYYVTFEILKAGVLQTDHRRLVSCFNGAIRWHY